ncbi:MAG: hypothetical protein ACYC5H_12240 [Methylovirgula sp.]
MFSLALGWQRERVPECPPTLVVTADAVWIWPGIPLTQRRGTEILPVAAESIRFWITRLHGPEAIDRDILRAVERAAECLKAGDEAGAQHVLDDLQLTELSQDGAVLIRAVADRLGATALDLPLRASMRTWNAQDIARLLPICKRHMDAARVLAKGAVPFAPLDGAGWDPEKHPRWPAGTPDSQGGQFAPEGGSDAAARGDVIPIAAQAPFSQNQVILVPNPGNGVDPLDPQGLNVVPPTPAEQQDIVDTLNIIAQGTPAERKRLQPHPYRNLPQTVTGAVLPQSVGGYTSYTMASGGSDRGIKRLIIDNATGDVYYTNLHYYSYYRVRLLP